MLRQIADPAVHPFQSASSDARLQDMRLQYTRLGRLARAVGFALVTVFSLPTLAAVPFAGEMAVQVVNYNRASSWLATGGAFSAAEMAALKAAGFINVIDLRRAQEGTEAARAAAEAAGLNYLNLPLGRDKPDAETLARFNEWVAAHQGESTLMHCASGNRAGTLWAMHLLSQQVPVEQAIQQGLAAGMAESRIPWLQESAENEQH